MPIPTRMREMIDEGVAALPEVLATTDPDTLRAERKLENELGAPLRAGETVGNREFAVVAGWVEIIAAIWTRFARSSRALPRGLQPAWVRLDAARRHGEDVAVRNPHIEVPTKLTRYEPVNVGRDNHAGMHDAEDGHWFARHDVLRFLSREEIESLRQSARSEENEDRASV